MRKFAYFLSTHTWTLLIKLFKPIPYLLRSIVDSFEHFAEWTFSNAFLFCENQLWVDFLLVQKKKLENK